MEQKNNVQEVEKKESKFKAFFTKENLKKVGIKAVKVVGGLALTAIAFAVGEKVGEHRASGGDDDISGAPFGEDPSTCGYNGSTTEPASDPVESGEEQI